jgi:hypothetical protein
LPIWVSVRERLANLHLPENAVFRRTNGGVLLRWRGSHFPHTIEIPAAAIQSAGECLSSLSTEELHRLVTLDGEPAPTDVLVALLVADRLRLKLPRGVKARGAALTMALRSAAQELYEKIGLEMFAAENRRRANWLKFLEDELNRREGASRRRSATELTAFAIDRYAGINWARSGLKSPMQDGDVEYFGKHYLAGPPVVDGSGLHLARVILERIEADAPKPPPRSVDARTRQLLLRMRERFRMKMGLVGR